MTDRVWLRTQKIVEQLAETVTGLGSMLVGGMVIVDPWGRARG